MQPRERGESDEQELFRSRLDQIIDLNYALVRLARAGRRLVREIEHVFEDRDARHQARRQRRAAGPVPVDRSEPPVCGKRPTPFWIRAIARARFAQLAN
jgi:hypothetical protein